MPKYRGTDGLPRDKHNEDKPTRRVDQGTPTKVVSGVVRQTADGKTRLAGLPKDFRGSHEQSKADAEPVVGWVVIVEGPGKGRALPLGYGMNDIARSPKARVPLDFGDDQVARSQHALITFDPRSLKFFVQHGGGKNLTYHDDAPVLSPRELQTGGEIVLGETRLRFVALCGPDFDWQKR